MTQITDKVYTEAIPLDATDIVIHSDPPKIVFSSKIQDPAQCGGDMICLPPGTWRFLFTTKSATEEDARKVVVPLNSPFLKGDKRYIDYTLPQSHTVADAVCTAIGSLASLLRSKNLDDKNNYALIEKLK